MVPSTPSTRRSPRVATRPSPPPPHPSHLSQRSLWSSTSTLADKFPSPPPAPEPLPVRSCTRPFPSGPIRGHANPVIIVRVVVAAEVRSLDSLTPSPPIRHQADEPVFGARAKHSLTRSWNNAVDRTFGDLVKFLSERNL